jgi:alpha-L-fucosidase 2
VSISWKNKQLSTAKIIALAGGPCKIRTAVPVKITGLNIVSVKDVNGYTTSFASGKGKTYIVSAL